uniref:Cadherin domain-containing protein n=1 Tax=Mesocestoides corti TaxID=53468 RepID=A0A5K3EQI3_MESCO
MLIFHVLVLTSLLEAADTTVGFEGSGDRATTVSFPLDEELPVGTLIGSLSERLHPKPATSGSVQFTLLGQENYIRLNQTSGQLFIRSRIDREALCEQVGTCCGPSLNSESFFVHPFDVRSSECALRLMVMDHRGSALSTQPEVVHIAFNIVDINDNPPKWSPDTLEIEIPEHSPIGTTIQLPEATDPDRNVESASIRYELIPQVENGNFFSSFESRQIGDLFLLSVTPFDQPYGQILKYSLQLKINSDLDREKREIYRLLLVAIDEETKSSSFGDKTGTLNIIVKVTDINDQAPFFLETHPSIEVAEDVAPGTRIFTMTAKDDDPSDATRLVYRFASTASGEVIRLFSLCERTGAITVAQDLDYEIAPLLPEQKPESSLYNQQSAKEKEVGYIIPIKVTDGVHFVQADLRVRLKNVNDNVPNITVQSHLPRWRNTNDLLLPEDVLVGKMVAIITMEDADERWMSGKSDSGYSEAHCATAHPFFAVHPLFPNSRYQYILATSRRLDRETKSTHTVTITCHDSGQPMLSRNVHLVIHLEDINDSPPVFAQSLYKSKIAENLPINTAIDKVQATDADVGLNAAIRYSIKADVDLVDLVTLDPLTGQLSTSAIFDREKLELVNFTVIAVDCAGGINNKSEDGRECNPIHSASASVVITVEDVNDCAPEFDQSNYEFVVKEGQRPQQSIGSVHAIDNDADPKNSRIQYSISGLDVLQPPHPSSGNSDGVGASSLFAITSNGEIYTRNFPIDREKTPILSFTVVAFDNGQPPLSAFANVVIRVQDVNDHAPVWVFPQSSNNPIVRVNISSYATVGREVAQLKAMDADSGPNGEVEYEIIKGNEQEYFALDKTSGMLYLAKPFGIETKLASKENNEAGSISSSYLKNSRPKSFILALKASDKGHMRRSNTTVLKIDVTQNGKLKSSSSSDIKIDSVISHKGKTQNRHSFSIIGDRDLIIITTMIVLALIISFILIAAIIFLRCRRPNRQRQNAVNHESSISNGKMSKRIEVLNCLTGTANTTESSQCKSPAYIFTDTERNPNFEEHVRTSHYATASETPVHRKIPMMHLDGDVYDRFSPAVLLSSSSHPSSRKGPSVGTSSDVVPIGYMVTSNPALFEPKLATYESIHLPSQVPNDAPVSSTENEKKAYNSLNCRLPKEIKATIEKKYMSLKPEFFTQDVYRKLNVGEVRDEIVLINRVQCDRELANGLTGLSQKRASVIQGRTEKGQISSRVCEATPKKHCRFELKSKAEETELLSKSKVLCGIQKQDGKF